MKAPVCRECDSTCDQSGRLTWYCPECDVCPECGCPDVDGFSHYVECSELHYADDGELTIIVE